MTEPGADQPQPDEPSDAHGISGDAGPSDPLPSSPPVPAAPPKDPAWEEFKAWHHQPTLWREIYTRTIATLVAALVVYIVALMSGVLTDTPSLALTDATDTFIFLVAAPIVLVYRWAAQKRDGWVRAVLVALRLMPEDAGRATIWAGRVTFAVFAPIALFVAVRLVRTIVILLVAS